MGERRFSSYRVGQIHVDDLPRAELLQCCIVFCVEAPDELLRQFIKDIADCSAEQLEKKCYVSIERFHQQG